MCAAREKCGEKHSEAQRWAAACGGGRGKEQPQTELTTLSSRKYRGLLAFTREGEHARDALLSGCRLKPQSHGKGPQLPTVVTGGLQRKRQQ